MRYGSLFAGIGGFDLALDRSGMECTWQVEIDDACTRVLARQWPDVRRYRDIRQIHNQRATRCSNCLPAVDVLVGGFPCQDVSVAGRRAGLAGERSGLWFEFHRLAAQLRPAWLVIENVPGLLSSNEGRDYGVIVQGLVELGYGVAWRVLNAQYFGVAQRRRRVFVVGCLGDPARAAQVLLERESCGWNPPPQREAPEDAAGFLGSQPPGSGWRTDTGRMMFVKATRAHGPRGTERGEAASASATLDSGNAERPAHLVASTLPSYGSGGMRLEPTSDPLLVTHALRAEGADASEDGTGRGTPLVMHGFDQQNQLMTGTTAPTMTSGADRLNRGPAISFQTRGRPIGRSLDAQMGVRRLTPVECERLQGFPDGWTEGESDSSRYRMLGNAVCVSVVEWIGRRLAREEME